LKVSSDTGSGGSGGWLNVSRLRLDNRKNNKNDDDDDDAIRVKDFLN